MRKSFVLFSLFLISLHFSYGQTPPLYPYDFKVPNLKGNFKFVFDSVRANKMQIYFAYDSGTSIHKKWTDGSFGRIFSDWEFLVKTDSLAVRVLRDSLNNIDATEAALIRANVKPIIFQERTVWAENVIKKVNALSKVVSDPPPFSKHFYFSHDTSYESTIAPVGEEFQLSLCKLKENFLPPIPNDICALENMDKTVTEETFKMLFIKKMVTLTPVDIKTQLQPLDSIAGVFYREWQKDILNFKKEQGEIKSDQENNALANKQMNSLVALVDSFYKLKKDTATGDFTATLKNRPLYCRNIDNPGVPIDNDPLRHKPSYSYLFSSNTISLDSVSLTTENGYITSIVIYPDSSDVIKYHLNKLTVIRRYIDLRSTRQAGEELDYYFPLESNDKVYHKHLLTNNRSTEPARNNIFDAIFLNLWDIIPYKPNIDSIGDVLVVVTNRNISFSKNNPNKGNVVLREKSLSSFVRLDIFTDLIGLAEDKPNGLIQAEAKADIGMFTRPILNSRYYSRVSFNFLHSTNINVRLSKIENKLRFLPLARDSVRYFNGEKANHHDDTLTRNTKYVRTIDILQYASLDATIRFNVLRFQSDFFICSAFLGGGIVRIPLNDTITGQSNGVPILQENKAVSNALKLTYGIQGQFKITHNIGAELCVEKTSLRLNRSDVIQVFNKYDDIKRKDVLWQSPPTGMLDRQLISLGAKLYTYFDRDQQKRLYIRLQYIKDMRTRIDDFFSFQFGYSTDIKGLVSVFKKETK